MKNNFIFEDFVKGKDNIISDYKKDIISGKKKNLSKILVKDLYTDFVSNYLLNKPYLMDVKEILLELKDKDFKYNKSEFLVKQKEIEDLIFESTKAPINHSFLKALNSKIPHDLKNDNNEFEKLFKSRFITFTQDFIKYCNRHEKELKFFSYLISPDNKSHEKSLELICYIFIHNIYMSIYKEIKDDPDSNMWMNTKEFQNLSINFDMPFVSENVLLKNFTNDLSCSIYLFFYEGLINNNKKNFKKYLSLIRLFTDIYTTKFDIFADSEREWLLFFHYWNQELLSVDNENEIFNHIDFHNLQDIIHNKIFDHDESPKLRKTISQKMVVDLFLALKHFCIESKIIESKTWKEFNKNSYDKGKVKTKSVISFEQGLRELDDVYLLDKRLELPLIYPPKDFKFKPGLISLNQFDYVEGGYLTNNWQILTKWSRFDRFDPFLKVAKNDSKVEVLNYLQSVPYSINKDYLNYIMNLSFLDIPSEYTKDIDLATYLRGFNKSWPAKWSRSNNENMKHFLLSLFIADIFKYCPNLYFTNFSDNRHRLYLSGFPLNYQADKLFRNLFILSEKSSIDNNDKYYKKYLKKEKDQFHIWSIKNSKDRSIFNYDAVSSVFQISGGLSGCIEALGRTGVLNLKDYNEDIYLFISKELRRELDYDKIKSLYKTFFDSNISKDNTFILMEEDQFIDNIRNSITRDMVKSHLMPFNYNKTTLRMVDTYLKKEFISVLFDKKFINKKLLNQIGLIIIQSMLDKFHIHFQNLYDLKYLFGELATLSVLLDEDIFLSIGYSKDNNDGKRFPWFYENTKRFEFPSTLEPTYEDPEFFALFQKEIQKIKNLSFYQSYYSINSIRFRRGFGESRHSVSINNFQADSKRNILKNKQALAPNIIQYIDSQLLYGVIAYCRLKRLPIIVIHDCFGSSIQNFENIRKAYSLSFFEIICKGGLRNIIFNALKFFKHKNSFFNKMINYITKTSKSGRWLFDIDLLKEIIDVDNKSTSAKRKFKSFILKQYKPKDLPNIKNLIKNFHKITKCLGSILLTYLKIIENYDKKYKDLIIHNLLKKINTKILSN